MCVIVLLLSFAPFLFFKINRTDICQIIPPHKKKPIKSETRVVQLICVALPLALHCVLLYIVGRGRISWNVDRPIRSRSIINPLPVQALSHTRNTKIEQSSSKRDIGTQKIHWTSWRQKSVASIRSIWGCHIVVMASGSRVIELLSFRHIQKLVFESTCFPSSETILSSSSLLA